MSSRTLLLLLLPLAGIAGAAETAPPLRAENAWVREAPPVAPVMAAYGRLCNDGSEAIVIASVESDTFERVEMHQTTETETSASMQQLEELVIGPHDCVEFAPGGRHFMLFNPAHPLQAGQQVTLTLFFARGDEQAIELPVRRQGNAGEINNGQHRHEH